MHANDKALRSRKIEIDRALQGRRRDPEMHNESLDDELLRTGDIVGRAGSRRAVPMHDYSGTDEPNTLHTGVNPLMTSNPRHWLCDEDNSVREFPF